MTSALAIHDLSYRPGDVLPRHQHGPATLSLILEGEQRETIGRRSYQCPQNSAVLKEGGIEHANQVGPLRTRGLFVELSPETESRLADEKGKGLGAVCFTDGVTRHLVQRIGREIRLQWSGAPLIVEGLIFELLGHLVRKQSRPPTRRGETALRRAVQYLESNYRARVSVPDVADLAGVHPGYLAELFRRHFGMSLGEWVRNRRLEFARLALRSTETPIAAIAFQAGFADQSHLTRLFLTRFGVTPGDYRRGLS
jgi:AraC family transcriptional regulator